jgi:hypothetical protein
MTLTVGHHKGRALNGDFGVAGTGTRQVAVLFEFTEGECQGEQLTWYGFFTPATAERTVEGLRNAGCTFPNGDLCDLTGLGSVEAVLVVEEDGVDDQGYPRLKIRWVNKLGGGVALGSRMNDAEKRALAAEMRGFVIAGANAQPSAAPSTPAPAPTSPTRPRPSPATAARTNGATPPRAPQTGRRSVNDDIPY